MSTNRREFLRVSAGLGAFAAAGLPTACSSVTHLRPAEEPLKILMLGGTRFLGPAIVGSALARGHEVTLFNRGQSRPDLFPDLERLEGNRFPDRDDGLKALEGREWDAVVDTSGYVPRVVEASAELLAPNVRHYTFISSISVYDSMAAPGTDEESPVGRIEDPTTEEIDNETYGPLKALCEEAAEAAMPGRVANIRPGYIVGPEDNSDRFTFWPVRAHAGGEMIAPGEKDDPVQVIDVRDLGRWIVHCIERDVTGVFNATGAEEPHRWGRILEACRRAAGTEGELVWIPSEFLEENEVPPGSFPIWLPPKGEFEGFHRVDVSRAVEAGLEFRPIERTVEDTLEWFLAQPEERRKRLTDRLEQGMPRGNEIIAAWKATSGAKSD